MADYDNRGQVSLWGKHSDDPPNAPVYKGTAVAHRDIKAGETLSIALWENDSSNDRAPVYKGKMEDRREKKGKGASRDVKRAPVTDDSFGQDEMPY